MVFSFFLFLLITSIGDTYTARDAADTISAGLRLQYYIMYVFVVDTIIMLCYYLSGTTCNRKIIYRYYNIIMYYIYIYIIIIRNRILGRRRPRRFKNDRSRSCEIRVRCCLRYHLVYLNFFLINFFLTQQPCPGLCAPCTFGCARSPNPTR